MGLGKNSAANLVGAVVPLLVTFTTVPAYLRLIGEERYGALSVIWVLLGYFGFFDFGLGRATTRQMAQLCSASDDQRSSLLWTTIMLTAALGVVGGCILWFSADYILVHFITMTSASRAEALGAIPWLVVALPLLLVTSAASGALQGRERFLELNSSGIIGNVSNQLIPLFCAWLGYRQLEYLVPAALTGRLISGGLLFLFCRRYVPLRLLPKFQVEYVRPLLSYGGWSSVISTLGPLLVTIDRMVIGALSGARAVTYYTVPYNLSFNCINLSGSLATALFPRLSAASPEEAVALADSATQTLVAIMSPVAIFGVTIYQVFLTRWMGAEFTSHASGVGEVILVGIWINSLVIPHTTRLHAAGLLKRIVVIYAIQIPIYLSMLWFGLRNWGVQGAAAAWCLRVALDTCMLLYSGGVLRRILSQNVISFLLVSGTMLTAFTVTSESLRWSICASLLVLSVCSGWTHLFKAARSVLLRRATQV